MFKKAKVWLFGLLAAAISVTACNDVSFNFKDVELKQIESVYEKTETSEALGIYFTSTKNKKKTPYAIAYVYLVDEIKVGSYDLDYVKSKGTKFFTVAYTDENGKEAMYASNKGTFELTSIDHDQKIVKGNLKDVEVKLSNNGELINDAIAIPEMEIEAEMLSNDEFEKAHKKLLK